MPSDGPSQADFPGTPPDPLLAARLAARDLLVEHEKVRTQYRNMPISIVGSVVVATLMGVALAPGVGLTKVLVWIAAAYAWSLGRLFQWRAFHRSDPSPEAIGPWRTYAIIGSLLAGTLWGVGAAVMYVPDGLAYQLFLLMGLVGMGSGCVFSSGSVMPSFVAFMYPAILPSTVIFMREGDLLHVMTGALMLLYMGLMTLFALRVYGSIAEFISLRFENSGLVEELRRRKEVAEEANVAKSRFLAAASHDLRQPLHALGLFVQALEDSPLATRERQIIGNIRHSVDAMEELFNALLDISRLDAGVVQPCVSTIPLTSVLDRVRFEYGPIARQKRVSLTVMKTSVYVLSDPSLLGRIVRNLLANAVRYTDRGGVVLGCRRRGNTVRIEVWDTGRGIPQERHGEIFREFHQLENPERDRRKGLGLGLAIVERLAKLLDHPVELRSVVGKGSMFAITVPLGAQENCVPLESSPDAVGVFDLAGALVLVIDDEGAVQEGMAALLRKWKCEVLTAGSGQEMLEQLVPLQRRPDLIVCDFRLRGAENGIGVVEMLRNEFNVDIPALLVTGDTAPDRLRDAEASGLPILHKPLNPARLRTLIANLLREHIRAA
ncbi:MAG: hybrid sensor histidine kinase/response regulator [Gammaproteobacteria bacterium]|nr:hybrid sensor histidine kinase/response regulator [Gammaproteobacteria bacterium]